MNKKDLVKRENVGPALGNLFTLGRFDEVVSEMDRMFSDMFRRWDLDMKAFDALQPKGSFPKVNVSEDETGYDVEIAVAGFSKDDVDLELKESCLMISANREEESKEEDKKFLRREIASRSFCRVIRFPAEINSDDVSAKYKDGVITCRVSKAEVEKPSSTKIEILE